PLIDSLARDSVHRFHDQDAPLWHLADRYRFQKRGEMSLLGVVAAERRHAEIVQRQRVVESKTLPLAIRLRKPSLSFEASTLALFGCAESDVGKRTPLGLHG